MRIYYYHTRPIKEALSEWEEHKLPGHILYGLTHLKKNGIESILHPYKTINNRWVLALRTAVKVLSCNKKYEALYGTSFRGLELIILLRALRIYRKPVIIWHHTAVKRSSGKLKQLLTRFFYKGIDKMFLFSNKLIEDSLKSGKVTIEKLKLIHWGADLEFYDHLLQEEQTPVIRQGFISTGKENRDLSTLLNAFGKVNDKIDIYISYRNGDANYKAIADNTKVSSNINIQWTDGLILNELAGKVSQKECVVICCLDFPYTVGLTTLVEAFALGIPVISSRNPYFQPDIDKEKAGITVPYYDVQGWIDAITYISTHKEEAGQMGKNGRKLAERLYNLEFYSKEIAEEILAFSSTK